MEQKVSMARSSDDAAGSTRQQDEYGNVIPQPSATAMYGGPSHKGGAAYAGSTGDAAAFFTGYYGGEGRQAKGQHRAGPNPDPTRRHGTTTGEHGRVGVGLMDRAKEKVENIAGFKVDFGHLTTGGEPMEGSK